MTRGVWVKASKLIGQPALVSETYPCLCWVSRRSCGSTWCPCFGRPDAEASLADCCARRNRS